MSPWDVGKVLPVERKISPFSVPETITAGLAVSGVAAQLANLFEAGNTTRLSAMNTAIAKEMTNRLSNGAANIWLTPTAHEHSHMLNSSDTVCLGANNVPTELKDFENTQHTRLTQPPEVQSPVTEAITSFSDEALANLWLARRGAFQTERVQPTFPTID